MPRRVRDPFSWARLHNDLARGLYQMKVTVLGTVWTVKALSVDAFVQMFGQHDLGITIPSSFEIFFSEEELNITTVRHELWHAAYASLCLSAATISRKNQEEIMAELFANHGPAILKLASTLLEALR